MSSPPGAASESTLGSTIRTSSSGRIFVTCWYVNASFFWTGGER